AIFSRGGPRTATRPTKSQCASEGDEFLGAVLSGAQHARSGNEPTGRCRQGNLVDGYDEEGDRLQSRTGLRTDGRRGEIAQLHEANLRSRLWLQRCSQAGGKFLRAGDGARPIGRGL